MRIPFAYLVQAVCDQFDITEIDLRLRTRDLHRMDARRVAVHILIDAGCRVTQAGSILHRNHATIIHQARIPLEQHNAETLLDAQRAAARRWDVALKERERSRGARRAAAR